MTLLKGRKKTCLSDKATGKVFEEAHNDREVRNGYLCGNRSLGEGKLRLEAQRVLDCALQRAERLAASSITQAKGSADGALPGEQEVSHRGSISPFWYDRLIASKAYGNKFFDIS
ncbi:MAG: hypothetical protein H5T73_03275 [Actinobacteria bacterium]|nr:hypothetical protein [Actinomycetota bacterium]